MRVVFEGLLKAVGVPPVRRVPMVVISGTIGEGRGGRVSARNLTPLLVRAFTSSSPEVVLSINSPGGSPAQSSQIYRAIMTLKQEHKKRVTAFVSDMAASGGYYVACAADEIIVDENSIVGSIGVISQWFGVTELLGKVGVASQIMTSTPRKAFMSPFQKEPSPVDVARLGDMQQIIHSNFAAVVRASRGSKLQKGTDYFDGSFWLGQRAVDLGVADAIGDPVSWLTRRPEPSKFDVMRNTNWLSRITSPTDISLQDIVQNSAVTQNLFKV